MDLYSVPEGVSDSFGKYIFRTRQRLGVRAKDVAKQLGWNAKRFRAWESGAPLPDEETYYRLLDLLDLDQESVPQALITPSPAVLAGHIRRRREEMEITQSELARRLSASPQTIHKWESGRVLPIPIYRDRVSEFLGRSIYTLYTDPSPIAPAPEVGILGDSMPPPTVLAGHIRHRREELAMTQPELGLHLGVSRYAIYEWESGKVLPAPMYRDRLSKFLGRSIYTLDTDSPPIAPDPEVGNLGDLMRSKRKELGLNQSALAHLLGVGASSLSAWETGVFRPKKRYWVQLAEFLGLEVEEFVGLVRNR